jgi:hypothetical protein
LLLDDATVNVFGDVCALSVAWLPFLKHHLRLGKQRMKPQNTAIETFRC